MSSSILVAGAASVIIESEVAGSRVTACRSRTIVILKGGTTKVSGFRTGTT